MATGTQYPLDTEALLDSDDIQSQLTGLLSATVPSTAGTLNESEVMQMAKEREVKRKEAANTQQVSKETPVTSTVITTPPASQPSVAQSPNTPPGPSAPVVNPPKEDASPVSAFANLPPLYKTPASKVSFLADSLVGMSLPSQPKLPVPGTSGMTGGTPIKPPSTELRFTTQLPNTSQGMNALLEGTLPQNPKPAHTPASFSSLPSRPTNPFLQQAHAFMEEDNDQESEDDQDNDQVSQKEPIGEPQSHQTQDWGFDDDYEEDEDQLGEETGEEDPAVDEEEEELTSKRTSQRNPQPTESATYKDVTINQRLLGVENQILSQVNSHALVWDVLNPLCMLSTQLGKLSNEDRATVTEMMVANPAIIKELLRETETLKKTVREQGNELDTLTTRFHQQASELEACRLEMAQMKEAFQFLVTSRKTKTETVVNKNPVSSPKVSAPKPDAKPPSSPTHPSSTGKDAAPPQSPALVPKPIVISPDFNVEDAKAMLSAANVTILPSIIEVWKNMRGPRLHTVVTAAIKSQQK